MKKIFVSFAIFLLLIITISISLHYLNTKYYYYEDKINSLEQLVISESWDNAFDSSNSFVKNWKKDSSIVTAYIHHIHTESITCKLLQLNQFIRYHDKIQSMALINEIKYLLKDIPESQKTNISNIF